MSETMTREQFEMKCRAADVRMKRNDGHSYVTILKTRCIRCGRSPKQAGKCPKWFDTFCEELYSVMCDTGWAKS